MMKSSAVIKLSTADIISRLTGNAKSDLRKYLTSDKVAEKLVRCSLNSALAFRLYLKIAEPVPIKCMRRYSIGLSRNKPGRRQPNLPLDPLQ